MEKIPVKFTSLGQVVDGEAGEVPSALKEKWVAQIEHTVAELHKNDIIWGDAKPENVLIDEDDNAWVLILEEASPRPGSSTRTASRAKATSLHWRESGRSSFPVRSFCIVWLALNHRALEDRIQGSRVGEHWDLESPASLLESGRSAGWRRRGWGIYLSSASFLRIAFVFLVGSGERNCESRV